MILKIDVYQKLYQYEIYIVKHCHTQCLPKYHYAVQYLCNNHKSCNRPTNIVAPSRSGK